MSDFITLSCPSCGGKLEITQDIERFACSHCGSEHVVRRGGGIVSLAPIVAGLKQVQVGVDKTASELAIQRLKGEILELQQALATAEAKARSVQADGKQAMNTALPGILLVLLTPIFGACCLATFGGARGTASSPLIQFIVVALLLLGVGGFLYSAFYWDRKIKRDTAETTARTFQETQRIRALLLQKNNELKGHQEIVR